MIYEYSPGERYQAATYGYFAVQDITALKQSEEHVRFLLGEMAHRSKNTLGMVQSIARLTAKHGDPATFSERLIARLDALGRNNMVMINDQWTSVEIERLAKSHLRPYEDVDENRIDISGPRIVLTEKAAQAIGMALHELATNALKYGALSNETGKVKIEWGVDTRLDGAFRISWLEQGGPQVSVPERLGFGGVVIRRMAASAVQGHVDLRYDREGLVWSLTAPLENIMEPLAEHGRGAYFGTQR